MAATPIGEMSMLLDGSGTLSGALPDDTIKDRRMLSTRHRNDIQGLRAVAVLLVALCHAKVGFLKGGFVGVDVFFVLSGFLITGLLLSGAAKGRSSLVHFYMRRARRILPAATLTLIATDLVAYRLLNFVRAKQVMQDSISAALFTANIHFAHLGTNYFAQSQPPSPVQHFWSLSVEEQFYLLWPTIALVALGLGLSRRRRQYLGHRLASLGIALRAPSSVITETAMRRLLAVVIVIGLASLVWSVYDTHTLPASAYFSTLTRAWELALGALLAIASPRLMRLSARSRMLAGWLGLFGIIVASVMFSSSTPFPGYAALLPTIGAALVIGAGVANTELRAGAADMLALTPLRYVGDRSYTFYLWHWPVLVIAAQYMGHELSMGASLLLLVAAFLLSIVTYGLFEHPIRQMKWSSPASALVLWPVCIVLATLTAGFILNSTENTKTRLAVAALRQPTLVGGQQEAAENAKAAKSAEAQSKAAVASTEAGQALPAVGSAVKAALQGVTVPAGLSPSPGELLNDYYHVPSGCEPSEGSTSSNVCHLGDTSATRSIVVFGDSHAQMWMPAILRMAQQDGWVVVPITKSGCTPRDWTSNQGTGECRAWYKWAVPQAEAVRPTVTLITGGYSRGEPIAMPAAIRSFLSLSTTMKRFSKSVAIIGDPPGQRQQPVDCLLAQGATLRSCASTLTLAQLSASRDEAVVAKSDGVGFIDTTGWFCAKSLCPMVIGHTIAYRDVGHVTQTYSLELAEPFAAALRRAVSSAEAIARAGART
jgi:peptidoglycan/LPS O-acetylase OafA/YrhL